MAMVTYPLNNVQYNAEDAELYNAVRMSGVWGGSAFDADVTGNDTIITIGEGLAWIANTKFSGKVVAQKEPVALDLGVADPSYNRIDVIAIQFNSVENKTDIIVKKGVASSSPEIPERSTTESLYELYLYSVLRTAGSSIISKSNITDLRDNREYCGYMQDAIKPGYAPSLMEHNKGEDFRFWKGTKADYEAQKDTISKNTFCVITDDTTEADILAAIERLSVDYIVEEGTTNDGWTYRKWNSGICELWLYIVYGPQTTGTSHITFDYPFELSPTFHPMVLINIARNHPNCNQVFPTNVGGNLTDEFKKMDVLFLDVKSTDFACYASVQVVARWK
jgi:hypothetical protein